MFAQEAGSIRVLACRIGERFWACDTQFFGLVSAAMALNWAVWLMLTNYEHFLFTSMPFYWLLRTMFPHWFLTLLFLLYGGGYMLAFLFDSTYYKRAALLVGSGLWSLIACSLFLAGPNIPSWGVYVVLAASCSWSFLRLK